jgi:hypothetical protein
MEDGFAALHEMLAGEPDVGNPQVRFDEGEQWKRHLRHPLFSTLLDSEGLKPVNRRLAKSKSQFSFRSLFISKSCGHCRILCSRGNVGEPNNQQDTIPEGAGLAGS